jgi:hypothetical protein
MKHLRAFTVVLLAISALVCSGGSLRAQESTPTLEAARQRWERLSPEEKERMRARYEQYRTLPEAERRALAERARRLQEQDKRAQEELPQEVREKIRKLDPEKRREVVKDLVDDAAREKGARIREKLPEAWIERLENAKPEQRAHLLAEFQRKARERVALGAIDKIGRHLHLPAEEVARLKVLPEPERAHAVLELTTKLSKQEAAEFGLPPHMTAEQWDTLQKLPPDRFFEEIVQHWRRQQVAHAEQAAENAGEREKTVAQLAEALRARPEEVVALAEPPGPERQMRLAQIRRERMMHAIRSGKLLAPERIQELERLSEPQFQRAVRELLPLGVLRVRPRSEAPPPQRSDAPPPRELERGRAPR